MRDVKPNIRIQRVAGPGSDWRVEVRPPRICDAYIAHNVIACPAAWSFGDVVRGLERWGRLPRSALRPWTPAT